MFFIINDNINNTILQNILDLPKLKKLSISGATFKEDVLQAFEEHSNQENQPLDYLDMSAVNFNLENRLYDAIKVVKCKTLSLYGYSLDFEKLKYALLGNHYIEAVLLNKWQFTEDQAKELDQIINQRKVRTEVKEDANINVQRI